MNINQAEKTTTVKHSTLNLSRHIINHIDLSVGFTSNRSTINYLYSGWINVYATEPYRWYCEAASRILFLKSIRGKIHQKNSGIHAPTFDAWRTNLQKGYFFGYSCQILS